MRFRCSQCGNQRTKPSPCYVCAQHLCLSCAPTHAANHGVDFHTDCGPFIGTDGLCAKCGSTPADVFCMCGGRIAHEPDCPERARINAEFYREAEKDAERRYWQRHGGRR